MTSGVSPEHQQRHGIARRRWTSPSAGISCFTTVFYTTLAAQNTNLPQENSLTRHCLSELDLRCSSEHDVAFSAIDLLTSNRIGHDYKWEEI